MSWKEAFLKIRKFAGRHHLLILAGMFAVWMAFLSESSFVRYYQLKSERQELESALGYYQRLTDENEHRLKIMKDDEYLEKFAREKYFMKRDNEDVFVFQEKE